MRMREETPREHVRSSFPDCKGMEEEIKNSINIMKNHTERKGKEKGEKRGGKTRQEKT